MQNTTPGAAFVRSSTLNDHGRAKTLFGLIGQHCGLADAAPRVYELLETPQTLATLERAIADDDTQNSPAAGGLESFLAELYRRDLIELSPDS